jgi:hypothetical protein
MGLDMYLTGKKHFYRDDEGRGKLQTFVDEPFKAQSVEVEIGYWRKHNAIHQWFVKNVQDGEDDCGVYYVGHEKLEELLMEVKSALNSKNPSTILPTQSGFFFGGTEYDEWYYSGLEDTEKIIETFLKCKNKNDYELYYQSSW